jgi:hypothetical protein
MDRIHLNWSGCRDWHQARARLSFLKTTLFGNFADVRGKAPEIRQALEGVGFTVRDVVPSPYADASFNLSGIDA